jgi:hypothetical protein
MASDDEVTDKEHGRGEAIGCILIACIVLLLLAGSGIIPYLLFPKWTDRASFGDMFGLSNALFSGLAFAGIIYAILLQRKELQLQRKELKMTREELRRTAEAQEANAKLMALTFFPAVTSNISSETLSSTKGNVEVLFLEMSNIGSTPTYDINVRVVGIYERVNGYVIEKGLVVYNNKKVAKLEESMVTAERIFRITKEGENFTLCDSISYPIIPQRKSIKVMLKLLSHVDQVKIMIQVRDIQGNNYCYLYIYRISKEPPFTLQLHSIEPFVPTITNRAQFDEQTVTLTKHDADFVENNFVNDWNRSCPIYMIELVNPYTRYEVWSDI